jgi:predicted  nucleic acid-binding Zn-ribbon protein
MTFVGKILVGIITFFAILFLAFSTVVFTTAKNWKEEVSKLQTKQGELQKSKNDLDAQLKQALADLEAAKKDHEQKSKALEGQIADLTKQIEDRQRELTEQRKTVAESQESMRAALQEAKTRQDETKLLRDKLAEVEKQANEFAIRQSELNDQIRLLTRQVETATNQNRDLRERVALLSSVIRENGLSDDIQQIKGVTSAPPQVEGQVTRVDARNQRVEISIGSDDGLVVGHVLQLWRLMPSPEYLGRVRVEQVDPDKSVAIVIGKTVQGKKIEEGDIVSSQIRPR